MVVKAEDKGVEGEGNTDPPPVAGVHLQIKVKSQDGDSIEFKVRLSRALLRAHGALMALSWRTQTQTNSDTD